MASAEGVTIRRAEASDLEGMIDAYEAVAAEGRYMGLSLEDGVIEAPRQ
ncbi:MAG: hypothetical protein M3360_09055 [Actinomycetota bacterium]|nr:hypothetical protein [Actinomycetota bacterium]